MTLRVVREALSKHRGVRKLHSGHLYQLLAYLRNREATSEPGSRHEGILLYPVVDEPLKVDVCLEGFSVRARGIDLGQDWRRIHTDMLARLLHKQPPAHVKRRRSVLREHVEALFPGFRCCSWRGPICRLGESCARHIG